MSIKFEITKQNNIHFGIQQAAADAEQQIHVLPIDLFKPCALLHVCRPPFRLHAFLDYNPFGAGCEAQVFAESRAIAAFGRTQKGLSCLNA